MKTEIHMPRFNLFHLAALVALLAIPLATLPAPFSLFDAGWILLGAIGWSVTDRTTLMEWVVLVAIGCVLTMLMMPAVSTNCGARKRLSTPPPITIIPARVPGSLQSP